MILLIVLAKSMFIFTELIIESAKINCCNSLDYKNKNFTEENCISCSIQCFNDSYCKSFFQNSICSHFNICICEHRYKWVNKLSRCLLNSFKIEINPRYEHKNEVILSIFIISALLFTILFWLAWTLYIYRKNLTSSSNLDHQDMNETPILPSYSDTLLPYDPPHHSIKFLNEHPSIQ